MIPRRNFSIVARCMLKLTRCLLLDVKSLVTRCKICTLLLARITCCKKITRSSSQKVTLYSLQNSLVTCCRICLLQKFVRYSLQNLLVTCCRSYFLLKSTRHSLWKNPPGNNIYLKPIKIGEFFRLFFIFSWSKTEKDSVYNKITITKI